MRRAPLLVSLLLFFLASIVLSFWLGRQVAPRPPATAPTTPAFTEARQLDPSPGNTEPTLLYAHNLLLRKGAQFRVYVAWIRGEMQRTTPCRNPSFDAPDSFTLLINKGVLTVKLNDLANFLNAGTSSPTPLRNVSLRSTSSTLQLHGTVHKLLLPLPVQLEGVLSPLPDGRLRFRLGKLSVLKVPVKGLLGVVHVQLDDLVPAKTMPGIEISGNDILFDTQKLLPPPHIRGQITSVTTTPTDLRIIYGNARQGDEELARWHNFLRLSGGTLDFGKLTMHPVDLTMIDATQDSWFDLDLVNYQAQLVYGTTRMTADAGLEIYMPNVDKLPTRKAAEGVTLEWLKNRNLAPPLQPAAPQAQ